MFSWPDLHIQKFLLVRNIFLFIRRYFNFLLFVFLQIISIYFIVNYSKYHQAAFGNFSNQITGKINEKVNIVEYYFQLKPVNDSLLKANENLLNKLRSDYEIPDSVNRVYIDSFRLDSLKPFRKFEFKRAKVVSNSVSAPNNFIILSKGSREGFRPGMGVIDENNAIIGIITETSADFSVVMSLLHKDSKISGKLKKTGETGTLSWDGKEPNIIILSGIAKSIKLAKGDTVITSGFSTTFPKGLMVGRIESATTDPGSSYVKIRIKTLANFYDLQFGYAIDNFQAEAINKLLDKVKKQQ